MSNEHVEAAEDLMQRVYQQHEAEKSSIHENTVVAIAQVQAVLALADAVRDLDHNITDLRSDIRDGYTSR